MSIEIYNLKLARIEPEIVMGEFWMKLLYDTLPGKCLSSSRFFKRTLSQILGSYYSSSYSQKSITPFIEKFNIDMSLFEETQYPSFNDFFIRRFRPHARLLQPHASRFQAFAEGRYFVFDDVSLHQPLPIKGAWLDVMHLLGNCKSYGVSAEMFRGGTIIIARLCPVDYHRFHFPFTGTVKASYSETGPLDSVNPIALAKRGSILFENQRHVTLIESDTMGMCAMIEVGALGVGTIVQSHTSQHFNAMDEKGYFLFGGSTVIFVCQANKVRWLPALISKTQQNMECLVELGTTIGTMV